MEVHTTQWRLAGLEYVKEKNEAWSGGIGKRGIVIEVSATVMFLPISVEKIVH